MIQLKIADIDTYNLRIIGEDVHIISENDDFVCYYPEYFRFSKDAHEGVTMIAEGKVYFSAWVEQGWDKENNCPSEEYKYYNEDLVNNNTITGKSNKKKKGSIKEKIKKGINSLILISSVRKIKEKA